MVDVRKVCSIFFIEIIGIVNTIIIKIVSSTNAIVIVDIVSIINQAIQEFEKFDSAANLFCSVALTLFAVDFDFLLSSTWKWLRDEPHGGSGFPSRPIKRFEVHWYRKRMKGK